MTNVVAKRVLITGGASGIGRLMAAEFAAQGAHLVIWDINAAGLSQLADDFKDSKIDCHTYQCDLRDRQAIALTARQMCEDGLHVDILINNAGIVSGRQFLELSSEQIEQTFAVNTMALFWVTREFLPGMIHNGEGHVVTIASAAALTGTARQVDYSASKFAAMGFDEALRVELHEMGTPVKTTIVCPFYIETRMFEGVTTRHPWLLPKLTPKYVVNRTIRAIQKNQQRIIMPRMVYSIFLLRLLPVAWMDGILRLLGISNGMDGFVGGADQRTDVRSQVKR